jgi:hypothetical protein
MIWKWQKQNNNMKKTCMGLIFHFILITITLSVLMYTLGWIQAVCILVMAASFAKIGELLNNIEIDTMEK